MQEAKQLLESGKLSEAVSSVLGHVKNNPTDISARIFLFELSLFEGNFDRADRQIEVIAQQDVNSLIGVQIYKQSLDNEKSRSKYFSEGLKPTFFGEIDEYVELLLSANNRVREGNFAEARKLLDKSEEIRPAFPCKINGKEVEDFRDYNDLTASVVECFIKESFCWLPFSQIKRIELVKPLRLREIFWTQAKIEMLNGLEGEMLMPALYANSWQSSNDQVRLGRATDWRELGEEIFIGEGQKLFFVEGEGKSFHEIETIEFNH